MSNLAAAGSQSVAAAVSVGIDIEMLNIASLETAIAATNHGDIDRVYSNLLHGSGNHLQAFKRNIRSS